ncbi:hypothetical protein MUK42_12395 [Musa troglodytarum]|uniref:Filament-like plant protein n=1 Tax=Musa troglodytarum TaxID=320322 RepID=A0A9E7GSN9_9LILI|nr:hypothetical protein MUK42_12395 [Musa troglodytarum]URE20964.1 hypothetical protein MUK42_12395 [Musa troglodytarum]URE20966.1 hypothetical protein MUK42_12395 [Musa troglodytarum]URE20969.1 hypothetical protein MUK42_12395 [Musa troglodytarum]
MSPRETEISGSLSSSQAYWDEPEVTRAFVVKSSPSHAQSTDDSLKGVDVEVGDTTKSITEKLASALVSICAKEDLVKQHAKVAEEALLGWEKSEKESTYLRQQLKTAMQKNTSLEEKLGHLDDALKECVRQLRQSKEEQAEKTHEWESHESELEARFTELQTQLEAKTESYNSLNHELCSKVETVEKENASLKVILTALTEDLHVRTLEMDLSIRAAETASKQHLEGIKKMAKLEAECRSLRARIQKPSLSNDHRFICNSLYGESLTDSQSDSGERLFGVENELSVPDSWASALIAELDQFKNEKSSARNLTSPVEIDLMDDFLEMERLAALTEVDYGSSSFEHEADLDVAIPRQSSPRSSPETMRQQVAVLEEKIEKMTIEKGNMETSIAQTNCQLKTSCDQLVVAEGELVELHRQLNLVNGEKHTLEIELETAEAKRKKMGLELETAHKEIRDLKHRLNLLEKRVDEEKPLSKKFTGWEKSEKESTYLRQQLKTAMQKNTSLEEKLGHLDDALKECVRQLRQSKEEQAEKTHEWESHESELEARFTELQTQLEAKTESYNSLNHELCSKVETVEKENASLKVILTALTEDLHVRTLEMDLSIRAAETASKQHLEGIKKMAKLEAECRSLRARIQKPSLSNDHRFICNSLYGESLTDSQSDSGERLFGVENELSVPDSWASALIAELDQFKNEKSSARNLTSPVEIDLMDDFLEMERLAALTEVDYGSSSFEHEADLDVAIPRQSSPRSSPETMRQQVAVLEEKIEKMTIEKGNMETSIAQTNCQLKTSCDQLVVAEGELVELHRQLNLVNGEKHTLEIELETAEAKRKKMGLELETAHKEIRDLKHRLNLLEKRVDEEKPLSKKFTEVGFEETRLSAECTYRYQNLGTLEEKRKDLESQIESANLELSKLHEKFDRTENKIEMFCFDNCPSMDSIDEKETQLEYQTNSANLEVHKLQEKVDLSEAEAEAEAEEQVRPSAEFESDIESLEAKKMELVVQLELEHMEVRSLQEKVQILEKQIEKEKTLTAEFAARCHTLEDELSTKQQSETQQSANLTASLNIRQEKEVAQAAGRLAKCQKTIASLNLQLKTLATLDDFLLEVETPESSGKTVELKEDSSEKPGGSSALCNGAQSLPSADCPTDFDPHRKQ